ncbi:HNH endonuclease [Acinetobacter bohemicus]|uniref:HNH endonuclease n=1 Tax=Acinetobacter bohemicus TaxID=1435036 RepID=UPI001BB2162A
MCCGFDFYKTYGVIGQNYIHVHHIIPISKIRKNYQVDPIKDLIPLCANCHAMIHRTTPALSIDKLKEIIKQYH